MMANPNPSHATRFSSENQPARRGRMAGARDKLAGNLLEELQADFAQNGRSAIEAARAKDPIGYLRICSIVVPKTLEVETNPLAGVPDDELEATFQYWNEQRKAAQATGAGPVTSGPQTERLK
jgi:hypothetical protein